MAITLKEQAWQSGLVLSDDAAEWNENDWPPLEGGCRSFHASVVLNHPVKTNYNNDKAQTVVVMGGRDKGWNITNTVLVLNLAQSNKQWRERPSMDKARYGHTAVVCNGGVYVMGGCSEDSCLNCIERIDFNDLLQSPLTTSNKHESHWKTLTCRLSTRRSGCCAVAVHNRYIVVMGGYNDGRSLSSVDIIDTRNHTVTAGPSMAVPRRFCTSAVIGHRIFVVGGCNESGNVDSVEYLDYATPCDNHETKEQTGSTFISFSPTWTTQSELRLSNARSCYAMVAVGSCLVVTGGYESSVEVLDTHHNCMWNLPPFGNHRVGCSMVTVSNQVAVIGGLRNPSCATLPLLDRNSWCFRRLCEQQPNGWHHSLEGVGIRDDDISPFSTSTSARKRARQNTRQNKKGSDET